MADATLSDLFNDARLSLLHARDARPSRGSALSTATEQLSRLTGALLLYPHLVTEKATIGRPSWLDAADELTNTLRRAAESLTDKSIRDPGTPPAEPGSQAWHISQATDALTAGRTLLRAHATSGPGADRSRWARVIGSAQVSAAITEEISHQAAYTAQVADQLVSRSRDNGATCSPELLAALRTAAHWLRQCADIPGSRTGVADPVLLGTIQPVEIPARIVPRPGESLDAYTAGAEASAQRLIHIATQLPGKASTSPVVSASAWQSAARSAATACGLTQMILRDLSWPELPRELTPPAGALRIASFRAALAGRAWNQAASAWQDFRTDSLQEATPAVTEADDLATRITWMAFDDPAWTPARGHTGMSTRAVASILHQAADSFACMAAGDLETIAAACLASRVYQIGPDIPRKSGPPLGQIKHASLTDAEPLRVAYAQAFETTEALAQQLDIIALAGGTQSGLLAHVRSAAPLECDVTWYSHRHPAVELAVPSNVGHAPGPVENRLQIMGVSDPALLEQAGSLDRAAEELFGRAELGPTASGKSRTHRQAGMASSRTRGKSGRKNAGRGD